MACKNCSSCAHEKNHEHHYEEKEESKLEIILYIISIIIFGLTFIPVIPMQAKITMYLLVILFSGYELILEGIKNIFKLNFEEDTKNP